MSTTLEYMLCIFSVSEQARMVNVSPTRSPRDGPGGCPRMRGARGMLKDEVILKGRLTQDLYKIPLPKNCGILSTFLFCRMGLTSSLGGLEGLDEAM